MKLRAGKSYRSKKRRRFAANEAEELYAATHHTDMGSIALKAQKNPSALSSGDLLQLQRSIGNRAVSDMISTNEAGAETIQRNPIKDRLQQYIDSQDETAHVHTLADHLLKIMNAMDANDYQLASDLLRDSTVLKSVGHTSTGKRKADVVNAKDMTPEEIDAKVIAVAKAKSMYFKDSKKLDLPNIIVVPAGKSATDPTNPTPESDARLAWQVLPIALEEWIHMFQHTIDGLLSEGTKRFAQTDEVQQNQMLPDGQGRWNMREVDIYAIYRDLGWEQILDEFESRYTEREKYKEYEWHREYEALQTAATMPFAGRNKRGKK